MARVPHYAMYGGQLAPPDPAPSPLGISPSSGPVAGDTFVGVYGNAMNTTTRVTIGGAPITNQNIIGTTMVQGRTPPGVPGDAPVVVHFRGGSNRCPEDFTYLEGGAEPVEPEPEPEPEPDPEGEGAA